MVGSSATRSLPASGSRWLRASATTSSLASRMRRARATISSPAGVSETLLGARSMSCTPRVCSSFFSCADSVGWLTKQRAAARPK
jgi:hypothetical protein